jgi:immune inhibitor A
MKALNQLAGVQFTDARFTGGNAETLTGDYKDEATIDSALTTANSGYYTAARLATMSLNDKVFALRSVTADKAGFLDTLVHARFSFVPTLLVVAFTNTSVSPYGDAMTYAWDFGDGKTSTATSPSNTYASAGTYQVTLKTTSNGRTSIVTKAVTVAASAVLAAKAAPAAKKK